MGVTTMEPEVPDAVKLFPLQEVALVELHERVANFPAFIDVGFAESAAVGASGGCAATVTVVVAVAEPPLPEQAIE